MSNFWDDDCDRGKKSSGYGHVFMQMIQRHQIFSCCHPLLSSRHHRSCSSWLRSPRGQTIPHKLWSERSVSTFLHPFVFRGFAACELSHMASAGSELRCRAKLMNEREGRQTCGEALSKMTRNIVVLRSHQRSNPVLFILSPCSSASVVPGWSESSWSDFW